MEHPQLNVSNGVGQGLGEMLEEMNVHVHNRDAVGHLLSCIHATPLNVFIRSCQTMQLACKRFICPFEVHMNASEMAELAPNRPNLTRLYGLNLQSKVANAIRVLDEDGDGDLNCRELADGMQKNFRIQLEEPHLRAIFALCRQAGKTPTTPETVGHYYITGETPKAPETVGHSYMTDETPKTRETPTSVTQEASFQLQKKASFELKKEAIGSVAPKLPHEVAGNGGALHAVEGNVQGAGKIQKSNDEVDRRKTNGEAGPTSPKSPRTTKRGVSFQTLQEQQEQSVDFDEFVSLLMEQVLEIFGEDSASDVLLTRIGNV